MLSRLPRGETVRDMSSSAPPPPPLASSLRGIGALVATIAVLTVGALGLGLLSWPRPEWSPSGAEIVSTVPTSLWALMAGASLVCLTVATLLTQATARLRLTEPAAVAWLVIILLAASALVANAIYAAALGTIAFGALIPIFHWLFTFVPALLAVTVTQRRERRARVFSALGTGVVTVPLFALGDALLVSPRSELVGSLFFTLVFGAAPLAVAAAIAGAMGDEAPAAPVSPR